jgi:hypothetical protein
MSPNKENVFLSANHRNHLANTLSPTNNQTQINNFQSPLRTVGQDILECLKSNKSKELLQKDAA